MDAYTVAGLIVACFTVPLSFSQSYRLRLARGHRDFFQAYSPQNWQARHRAFLTVELSASCLGYGGILLALANAFPRYQNFLRWPLLACLVGLGVFTIMHVTVIVWKFPKILCYKDPFDEGQGSSSK